jgi:hypothetical protein
VDQDAKFLALQKLSKLIRDVEEQGIGPSAGAVGTGWNEIDQALAGPDSDGTDAIDSPSRGLRLSGIHEFYSVAAVSPARCDPYGSQSRPLCLLAHLARQGAAQLEGHIAWVGPQSHPTPQFLERLGILDRSLFVDATDAGSRLWAIELSMRCPAVACVVGDAQGFKISATRRLELVARDCNCLALLARPGSEIGIVSAAMTRWAVHPLLHEKEKIMDPTGIPIPAYRDWDPRPMPQHPAWMLELLCCKGMQPAGGNHWPLEWDCAKGAVVISAAMVHRLRIDDCGLRIEKKLRCV